MADKEIERIIEVEEDRIHVEAGGTRLTVTGVLSTRHAQILVLMILAMLGFNYEEILSAIGGV
jgi:hypothetical protein